MSATIDERIVSMKFDNSEFEKNVKESMSTLDKLKEKLKLKDATTGLDELSSKANNLSLSHLSTVADNIGAKFSRLWDEILIGGMRRVGEQAVQTGERLLKAFTVDNISAGWSKFEEKTRSVGTLVSQGFDMSEVNEQLERLMWFTDETSYNFTDMVNNIGKFTASGAGLEESVTAMEGIATWAAMSGQNATTASRAMYQLSQAMSKGVMRLEDYKSIQNANMDTREFREQAVQAALACGQLKKVGADAFQTLTGKVYTLNELFSDGLTKSGWFDKETMMSVFNKYSSAVDAIYEYADAAGITASEAMNIVDEIRNKASELGITTDEVIDKFYNGNEAIKQLTASADEFGLKSFRAAQEARTWSDVIDSVKDAVSSKWMQTFEIIFGQYDEAVELFTDLANRLYDIFAASGDARNEMLGLWKELGGRKLLVESFYNIVEALSKALGAVKEGFRNVFPAMDGVTLVNITKKFRDFTQELIISDKTAGNIKDTFSGLFAIFRLVGDIFKTVIQALFPAVKGATSFVEIILRGTGAIGRIITALVYWIEKNQILTKSISLLKTIVATAIGFVVKLAVGIADLVQKFFELEPVQKILKGIVTVLKSIVLAIAGLITVVVKLVTVIKNFAVTYGVQFLKRIGEGIVNIKDKLVIVKNFITEFFTNIVDKFDGFKNILSTIKDAWKETFAKFNGDDSLTLLDKLKLAFESLKEAIQPTIDKIKEFASEHIDPKKIGIIALISLLTLITLSFVRLAEAIGDISDSIKKVGTFFSTINKVFKKKYAKNFSDYAIEVSIAVAILAGAVAGLAILGSDPKYDLGKALGTIAILSGILVALAVVFEIMDKKLGGVKTAPLTMLGLSAGIAIMAASLYILQDIKTEGIMKKLLALTAIVVLLGGYGYFLSKVKGSLKTAVVLLSFALAIKMVIKSLYLLNGMDLTAVEDHLGELITVITLLAVIGLTAGKVGLGSIVSLLAICYILKTFGEQLSSIVTEIQPEKLLEWIKSNTQVVTALGVFVVALMAIGKWAGEGMRGFGLALLGIAATLLAMVGIMAIIYKNFDDPKQLWNAAGVVMAFMAFIALLEGLAGFTKESKMMAFAASMGVLSIVLTVMLGITYLAGLLAKDEETMKQGIVVIGIFTLMVALLEGLSALTGKAKFGPLIAMIGAVISVVGSIVILANLFSESKTMLASTIGAFLMLGAIIAGLVVAIKQVGKMTLISNSAFKTLIAMVGGIVLLMGSLIVMAKTVKDPGIIVAALGGCTAVILSLSLLVRMISKSSGLGNKDTYLKKIATIGAVSAAVAGLMSTLVLFKDMEFKKLAAAVGAMTIVFGALIGALKLITLISKSTKVNNIIMVGVMAAGVAAITSSLALLANIEDPAAIFASMTAVFAILVAFSGILLLIDGLNVDIKAIVVLGTAALSMIPIAIALKQVAGYEWDQMYPGFVAMAGVLLVMGGIMALLAGISSTGVGTVGIFAAAAAVVILAGAFWLIGDAVEKATNSFTEFLPVLGSFLIVLNKEFAAFIPTMELFFQTLDNAFIEFIATFNVFTISMSQFSEVMTSADFAKIAIDMALVAGACYLLGNAGTVMGEGAPGVSAMAIALQQLGVGIIVLANSISMAVTSIFTSIAAVVQMIPETLTNVAMAISEGATAAAVYLGQGFILGLATIAASCIEAVFALGESIVNSFNLGLGVHSPSWKAEDSAVFFGDGAIRGANKSKQPVGKAFNKLGEHGVKEFEKSVTGPEAENAATTFGQKISNLFSSGGGVLSLITNGFSSAGTDGSKSFGTSLLEGIGDVINSVGSKIESGLSSLKNLFSGGLNFDNLFSVKYEDKNYTPGSPWRTGSQSFVDNLKKQAEETLNLDKAVKDFNDTLGENASALGGAGSAASQAKDQYASLKETIAGQIDIFSEFSKKTDLTADQLLKNMRSQVQGVAEWAVNMQTLAGKGVDQGLLMKLQEMGPQGFEYVNAFVNMTTEQLTEANTLWGAALALPDMAASMLVNANPIGANLVMGLNQGVDENKALTAEQMALYGQETLTQLMTALGEHSPSVETHQMGIYLVQGFINGILVYTPIALSTINSFANAVLAVLNWRFASSNFVQFGANIIEGIVEGINSNAGAISAAIDAICAEAIATFQFDFDMHSPSRVFKHLAEYIPMGAAQGITHGSHFVSESMDEMASMAIEKMKSTVELISDAVNLNVDSEPVIRPVLDLSGIQNESKKLNSIMSYNKAIGANITFERSKVANSNVDQVTPDQASTFNFTQNNYSPKALSRIDIYRQTKNQFATLKGMVNGI